MSIIYLIRHGQASFGSDNYDKLSDIGVRQAQILGKHFADINVAFDAVYTGAMDRQMKTAEEVVKAYESQGMTLPAPEIKTAFDEFDSYAVLTTCFLKLAEKNPDLFEGMKNIRTDKKLFQRLFEKSMFMWIKDEELGDLTKWVDFQSRVCRGVNEIVGDWQRGANVAVFTSGGPISVVVQRALNLSDEKTMELSWQINNASITRIKFQNESIMLHVFNDLSYLETQNDPNLVTYR